MVAQEIVTQVPLSYFHLKEAVACLAHTRCRNVVEVGERAECPAYHSNHSKQKWTEN